MCDADLIQPSFQVFEVDEDDVGWGATRERRKRSAMVWETYDKI